MSIRARLALGAAAAVAIAIVLASVIVYFLVRGELRNGVDRDLRTEATQIGGLGFAQTLAYPPNIYQLEVPAPLFAGYFQEIDEGGNIYIPESYVAPKPELPVTPRVLRLARGIGGSYFYDTRLGGVHARVFTV